jgi:hypothetical protein
LHSHFVVERKKRKKIAQMIKMGQQFFYKKIAGFTTNLCNLAEYDSSECGHLFLEGLNAENCLAVIPTF